MAPLLSRLDRWRRCSRLGECSTADCLPACLRACMPVPLLPPCPNCSEMFSVALLVCRWGLSFSNFSIGTVGITQPNGSATPVATTQRFLMTVPITNSGPAGRATIQVYARPSFALVGQAQPVNRLLCWSQVAVPANGHATATISCAASDLGMWDLGVGDYIVQGGHYSLTIAQYSGDPHAASAGVDVASTPTPAHGESMRDQARAYAKAHGGM